MPKLEQVSLPSVQTVEDLRQGVEAALNRLVLRLNNDKVTDDVDANDHRIRNLSNPAEYRDAVNVAYVQKAIDGLEKKLVARLHRPNLSKAIGFDDAEFTVGPGGFTLTDAALEKFVFDPTNFTVNGTNVDLKAGGIGATEVGTGAIMTPHLYAGAILVGGGANRPTQFTVYDHNAQPVGWIGDDWGNSNYDGAWFKRVLIGGTSPATAKIFADANGNTVLKTVYVYDTSGTIGWIGNSGLYYGGWFKQLYVGGSGPMNAPLRADSNGNVWITGATFEVDTGSIGAVRIAPDNSYGALEVYSSGGYATMIRPTGICIANSLYWHYVGVDAFLGYGDYGPELNLGGGIGGRINLDINMHTATIKTINGSYGYFVELKSTNSDAHVDIGAGSLKISGNIVISSSRNASFVDVDASGIYKMDGATIIDASKNASFANIDASGVYKMDGTEIINSSGQFIGAGVACTGSGIGGTGFNVYSSGWYYGQTLTGLQIVTDVRNNSGTHEKKTRTIDIRGGVITSISSESAWTAI